MLHSAGLHHSDFRAPELSVTSVAVGVLHDKANTPSGAGYA
jgi:hypothetical protein